MPCLDQSVAKDVGSVLSKICNPLAISLVIINLEWSKAC